MDCRRRLWVRGCVSRLNLPFRCAREAATWSSTNLNQASTGAYGRRFAVARQILKEPFETPRRKPGGFSLTASFSAASHHKTSVSPASTGDSGNRSVIIEAPSAQAREHPRPGSRARSALPVIVGSRSRERTESAVNSFGLGRGLRGALKLTAAAFLDGTEVPVISVIGAVPPASSSPRSTASSAECCRRARSPLTPNAPVVVTPTASGPWRWPVRRSADRAAAVPRLGSG